MKQQNVQFLNTLDALPLACKVFIYGAGLGGSNLKQLIEKTRKDIELLYFIDDYRKGRKQGIQILSPEELLSLNGKSALILVASAHWKRIERRLTGLKIANYRIVNPHLYFAFQIFTQAEEKEYLPDFNRVKGLLQHKQDSFLYDLVIENRKIKQKNVDDPHKYFLSGLNRPGREYLDFIDGKSIHTIIEGGVFDGESTVEFLRFLSKQALVYGFEPLYEAYMESRHRAFLDDLANVKIYPLALWNSKTSLHLLENKEDRAASKIVTDSKHKENTRSVAAISIDEFVKENNIRKVDFIKLDIEGSELESLRGAAKTLMEHRPQLAVCIYHKKEHLFEIPLFLSGILKDYTYRIGHYSSSFWRTIWYALPNEIYVKGS